MPITNALRKAAFHLVSIINSKEKITPGRIRHTIGHDGMCPADPMSTESKNDAPVLVLVLGRRHAGATVN